MHEIKQPNRNSVISSNRTRMDLICGLAIDKFGIDLISFSFGLIIFYLNIYRWFGNRPKMITFFLLLWYITILIFFLFTLIKYDKLHKMLTMNAKAHTYYCAYSHPETSNTNNNNSKCPKDEMRWNHVTMQKQSKKTFCARGLRGSQWCFYSLFCWHNNRQRPTEYIKQSFQNWKWDFNSLINFWQICGQNLFELHYKISNL